MSTKFYLHDATTTDTGTLPGATTLSTIKPTPDVTASGASTNRVADTTIGGAQTSVVNTNLASATQQISWLRRWISAPIVGLTFSTVKANYAEFAATATSNATSNIWGLWTAVYVWRPSNGSLIGTLFDVTITGGTGSPAIGPFNATATGETWGTATGSGGGTPPTITAIDGDVLVFEAWRRGTLGMASAYTDTLWYDGTAEGSSTSAASYVLMDDNITFIPAATSSPRRAISKQQAVNRATSW